jgi:hypothetical protein
MLTTQNVLSLDQGKLRPANQTEDEFYAAFLPARPAATTVRKWPVGEVTLAGLRSLLHVPAR